jgi:predicted NUDIX family NTP pyrophosphohydrolase
LKLSNVSAGIVLFRKTPELRVLLAHPGGPFWMKKDLGGWTIPKGLIEDNEDPLKAAIREFFEEIGLELSGPFQELGSIRLKSGKTVCAWSCEDLSSEPIELKSNTFTCEWPPHSGKIQEFPEIDRCDFFTLSQAKNKINSAQVVFLDRLEERIKA